jgi:glycosyltransferase involved in cell wall biosynthesis
VDRGDAKTLADRILLLLERPDLARAMGAAGRARVQQCFTIERMAAQFEALYLRILNMNGGI